MSDNGKQARRNWARGSGQAIDPTEVCRIADTLDTLSDNGGMIYYARAETLRILAEQMREKTSATATALTEALDRADAAEAEFATLKRDRAALRDMNNRQYDSIVRLNEELTERADAFTAQATQLAETTTKLDRAEKRAAAMLTLLKSVIAQIGEGEDGVDIVFEYGDFAGMGIDLDTASDLGVKCVLGLAPSTDDVLSQSGR